MQDDNPMDDSSANEESCADTAELPPPVVQQKFSRNASLVKRIAGVRTNNATAGSDVIPAEVSTSPLGPTKSDSFESTKPSLNPTLSTGTGLTHDTCSLFISTAVADIHPEPLDKFWESKAIREKRQELDKKIEQLRKKHEKDRKNAKPPKKSQQKLVKRISSKNL